MFYIMMTADYAEDGLYSSQEITELIQRAGLDPETTREELAEMALAELVELVEQVIVPALRNSKNAGTMISALRDEDGNIVMTNALTRVDGVAHDMKGNMVLSTGFGQVKILP